MRTSFQDPFFPGLSWLASMKIITVVSYPRTGSSLLMHRMKCSNATVLLEIFHPNPLVAKKHLEGDKVLKSMPDFIQGYTREAAIQDPVALIDAIARIKLETNAIIFKIFPAHLPDQALAKVIARSDTLLIHSRNRIHSFISDVIATRLCSWSGTITNNHYVDFCSDSFKVYSRHIHDFMLYAIKIAIDNKTTILFSEYEKIIEPVSRESVIYAILAKLLGSNDVAINSSGWLPKRQDERVLASQKVVNSDRLLEFLGQHNLVALDRGTFDIKFSQYSLFND